MTLKRDFPLPHNKHNCPYDSTQLNIIRTSGIHSINIINFLIYFSNAFLCSRLWNIPEGPLSLKIAPDVQEPQVESNERGF